MTMCVCMPDDMHPYACDGLGRCVHCDRRRTKHHRPSDCWLCHETKQRHRRDCKLCAFSRRHGLGLEVDKVR